MLKAGGFQVETAHDGIAAIETVRRFHPAIILLDIGLPGINGYDVARTLRQDDCCRSALMVALSGYGDEKAREPATGAGFDHHLTRPVDFDRLMALIN
jgi:CheY-like chemotaxis protein